jgi:iron complex outermembrane receptor protein
MKLHVLLGGASLPVLALAAIMPAFAQSTGTEATEETVIVTGQRNGKGGLIKAETVPKTRSTVDQSYFKTQSAGQSALQNINLLPGVNFTNNDPYGSSGGNIRMRGFDGNRISLTSDGMPLNDTGNYAIFSNQLLDAEVLARTTVNVGTTDVDSPTASATGGTVNSNTRKPDEELTFRMTGSAGDFDYGRAFLSVDSGAIGPWDTTAFIAGSYQKYDKFRGPGELEKKQYNGRIYQDIGENGDFVSISMHYNENRNNSYRSLTQFTTPATNTLGAPNRIGEIGFYGYDFDFLPTCTRDPGTAGVTDNENATTDTRTAFNTPGFQYLSTGDNPANTSSCSNYYNLRINPSNTGNIRAQSSFTLADNLKLTVDPSFQYVLATGGNVGFTQTEFDGKLGGANILNVAVGAPGTDLNGDGDVRDTVRVNSPSVTNTYRYGLNTSLLWDIDENQTLRIAYTLDYGRHRQTGANAFLQSNGDVFEQFGGRDGATITSAADGSVLRFRDRFSIAKLNQFAISYNGSFYDDTLKVALGLRLPFFERELNQNCYTANGTSNPLCTTEPVATTLANGNVTFLNRTQTGGYIPPFAATVKYDAVLPNVGISYEFAENHILYASFAQGLSAPRTDSLYTVRRNPTTFEIELTSAEPEKTDSFDLGYRYQGDQITASVALWKTSYSNRIVNAFDDLLGIFVDRNVGKVELQGFDAEVAYQPDWLEGLTLYASTSYIDSELKENVPITATTFLATKGKELVETPEWTFSARAQYTINGFTFGLQGKYVGDRWATDVNDEVSPGYFTMDGSIRYDFESEDMGGAYIQLNAINIFDKGYLGSISSQTNALSTQVINGGVRAGSAPTYQIGAPATLQLNIGLQF